jgi:hypothetical protein
MARRINLQSLIDEVLDMVKKKKEGDQGQNFEQRNWLSNEAYNKDIRARNTEIERQNLINAGNLAVQKEHNAGEVARQGLTNIGNENVANIQGRAHVSGAEIAGGATKYSADQTLQGEKIKAGKGPGKSDLVGLTAILEDPDATPEEKVRARRMIFNSYGNNAIPNVESIAEFSKDAQPSVPPTTPVLPVSKTTSAPSMTFPTNIGTRQNPLREKREAEDAFYRLNPQLKRKKENWFNF